MALNTDALPNNLDESKCYAPKGKTLSILIKKAKQKLIFSKRDFTVSEDDNKLSVQLRTGINNPYLLGDDESWDINAQPDGYDGVRFETVKNTNDGGVVTFYSRTIVTDGSGRTVYVGAFSDVAFAVQGYA